MVYEQSDKGFYLPNLFYCKGCGICARECPADAIGMVDESE
jgi:pyruvate ferredoxin oxidoreductase delta subunit